MELARAMLIARSHIFKELGADLCATRCNTTRAMESKERGHKHIKGSHETHQKVSRNDRFLNNPVLQHKGETDSEDTPAAMGLVDAQYPKAEAVPTVDARNEAKRPRPKSKQKPSSKSERQRDFILRAKRQRDLMPRAKGEETLS